MSIKKTSQHFTTIMLLSLCTSENTSATALTQLTENETREIEQKLEYVFKDKNFLSQVLRTGKPNVLQPSAFSHLEFLGDKIIGSFVAGSVVTTEEISTVYQYQQDLFQKKFNEKTSSQKLVEAFKSKGLDKFLNTNSEAANRFSHDQIFKALVGAMHLDSQQDKPLTLNVCNFMIKALQLNKTIKPAPFSRDDDSELKRDVGVKIGYTFSDSGYLRALYKRNAANPYNYYSSYYTSTPSSSVNQQMYNVLLAFLGDKILGAIVASDIFSNLKDPFEALKKDYDSRTSDSGLRIQYERFQLKGNEASFRDSDVSFKPLFGIVYLNVVANTTLTSFSCPYQERDLEPRPSYGYSPNIDARSVLLKILGVEPIKTQALSRIEDQAKSSSQIQEIEKKIGYTFKNKALLTSAFQHSSITQTPTTFEQLEFLGDRIINMIVADNIFSDKEPIKILQEAFISKTKNTYLQQRYMNLGLQYDLIRNPASADSVYADALEALVGAIHLDSKTSSSLMSDETFTILSRIIGYSPSSLPIPVAQPMQEKSSARVPQFAPPAVLPTALSSSSTLEAAIQKEIASHKKWNTLSDNEKRMRALTSLESKKSSALKSEIQRIIQDNTQLLSFSSRKIRLYALKVLADKSR